MNKIEAFFLGISIALFMAAGLMPWLILAAMQPMVQP